ncbi:MAG: hypothetical protein NZ899_10955 [Thermoguttaceae bacterium]|nr:hypothetical protein [Thermoguttaceae bacterium]MDW8079157.1 hypothetical protein [Thermoguttaceae bacterium]
MTEQVMQRIAELLRDLIIFVVILFVLVILLIVLRSVARTSVGGGGYWRKPRTARTNPLEDLPPYAKRRAELAKNKSARRSWFGFRGGKVSSPGLGANGAEENAPEPY